MPDDASQQVTRMIEAYRIRLIGIIERRLPPSLRSTTSAEDILQIVFHRATQKFARYASLDPPVSEFSWLYTIAMDCISEEYQRATRLRRDQRRNVPLPEGSSMGLVPVDERTGPSAALRKKEAAEAVQQILAELKPQHTEILLMRTVDELKYKEVAEVLEISEIAAATRHHRAVKEFGNRWRQRFSSWEGR